MANTYTKIYLQLVFAVHNRASILEPEWKDELCKYITGIVKKNGHKLIAINGTQNHIHILIGYNPEQKISDLLQDIKGSSSKWINKKGFARGKFKWQAGYGAFSYSRSQINNVSKYILNQEHHHKKKTFHEEYIEFLDHYDISYDERFISKDIK
jgi:REP element-mobilizing transposase RayT